MGTESDVAEIVPLTRNLPCAAWSQSHAADPIGSAGTYDRFVLVEWPLPWPKDIGELDELAALIAMPKTRVQLVVPGDVSDLPLVTCWQRTGSHRLQGFDRRVAGDVAEAVSSFTAGERTGGWTSAPVELLVCTHGRRDRCCGSDGTRMFRELQGTTGAVRVRRCSHTGGHRFAPTAISFPDGRYWAALDAGRARSILERSVEPESLHRHQRGNSALDPWAQVIERAAFERYGWDWLDWEIAGVKSDTRTDPGSVLVEFVVSTASRLMTIRGAVEIARELLVPTCGGSVNDPTKASIERRLSWVVWDEPATDVHSNFESDKR